jgi:DNA modification methylase
MIRKEIEHLAVSIDELQTHPSNVRQGDVGAICESLKAHGQYRPIVFQQSTKRILAGNHTYKAAKALGWTHIAATPIICDDQQALRILLADNKANDLATYDEPELIELLKQLVDTTDGLLGTLFDEDELDSLIEDNSHFELPTDVDDVPEDVPAISKLGDVWLLGEHRVMCGDSTEEMQVEKLMNKNKPDVLFTDPPYGVDYVAMRGGKKIVNDSNLQIAEEVMIKALSNAKTDTAFVCCNWRSLTATIDAMIESGFEPKACIVWDKESRVQNLDKYAKQHEFILYAGKYGGQKTVDVDVWRIARDFKPDHPTPKPVELVSRALLTSSVSKSNVLDLFGGSGSTLIAAQETNRTAYLMELDPNYVDVICARYQKHTGNQPILEATGEAHNFTPDANQ